MGQIPYIAGFSDTNNKKIDRSIVSMLRSIFGAPGRIRTCDLPVRSRALYPLSYKRMINSVYNRPVRSICQACFYHFFAYCVAASNIGDTMRTRQAVMGRGEIFVQKIQPDLDSAPILELMDKKVFFIIERNRRLNRNRRKQNVQRLSRYGNAFRAGAVRLVV